MKLLAILVQFFRWLASRNEAFATAEGQAKAKAEREAADAAKVQDKVDSAQKAVRDGKEDDVNKTLRDMGVLLAVLVCAITWGCASSKVIYIEQDDAAVRYELNGKQGWWLPDATMARLLEKAIRNSEAKP